MDCIRYKIGTDSALDWFVYHEPSPFEANSLLCGISTALAQVKQVFEDSFGAEYVRKFRSLSVMHTTGAPTTYRDNGLIFIQAEQSNWQQYIYQFAHELCHFMIPTSPIPELRWFEESLCETASLFSLTKIYEKWSASENPPLITNPSFTASFPSYISDHQKTAAPLVGLSIHDFIVSHLSMLEKDCYLREYNRTIANAMLPLFLEHPYTWSAIPALCHVPSYCGFRESLLIWKDTCLPSTTDQIDRLISLLTNQ